MRKLLILLLFASCSQAQTRTIYAVKDKQSLYIDHYKPSVEPNGISVMFVHGGGFTAGDPANQKPMADGLSKLGYNVYVISYRLYLKGGSFGCNTTTPEKLKAIRLAVEDAGDAARFILDSLHIDKDKFFIAGSSAGAETILQLLYNPFGGVNTIRFRGAMVFSGALLDINTVTPDNWVPTLFMHGTKDQLVPFGTAAHHFCKADSPGWMIMFGAKTIYEKAKEWGKPVVLYTYEGKGHEVANFMFREFEKMDGFMKAVVKGERLKAKEVRL